MSLSIHSVAPSEAVATDERPVVSRTHIGQVAMKAPEFFVPKAEPGEQESAYVELAAWAQRQVPPAKDRVYSITFEHDGVEWTATVGERLKGHTIANPRARAKMRRIERPRGDSATVLAIFAGPPYIVVTDGGAITGGSTAWANPFMAGQPTSATHFRPYIE